MILWKDVDGIKRLNPRWGIDTPAIDYLGYGQASELALHGTPVIHPATVSPLIEPGIPLEIRNIKNPTTDAPTVIGPDFDLDSIVAIGCQPGVSVITQEGPLNSDLLSRIESLGVEPWLMESTREGMKLIVPTHDLQDYENLIHGKIEYRTGIISIIGNTGSKIIEHELVSKNEYGARYIIDTDDLSGTILELYQSLFSLQDCK